MVLNMIHGDSSGGAGGTLTVTAPAGVTVTAAKDGKSYTRTADAEGVAVFKGLSGGTWEVTISDGIQQPATVSVGIVTDYEIAIDFNVIPVFSYTGDYEIVNDNDEAITSSPDNWKIRFLTSGMLTVTDLNGSGSGIDVFLVGGGGGGGLNGGAGGGGGYTSTGTYDLSVGTQYEIVIGAGGKGAKSTNEGATNRGSTGGTSSAFGFSAAGGKGGGSSASTSARTGGAGGSGGGSGNPAGTTGGDGGEDGGNGAAAEKAGGTGQGMTTREFGESDGKLYAGGGAGSGSTSSGQSGTPGTGGGTNTTAATENTGGGGGGGNTGTYKVNTDGASGIVIIRNARGAA